MEALAENWFFLLVILLCIAVHMFGHGHGHGHGHDAKGDHPAHRSGDEAGPVRPS